MFFPLLFYNNSVLVCIILHVNQSPLSYFDRHPLEVIFLYVVGQVKKCMQLL